MVNIAIDANHPDLFDGAILKEMNRDWIILTVRDSTVWVPRERLQFIVENPEQPSTVSLCNPSEIQSSNRRFAGIYQFSGKVLILSSLRSGFEITIPDENFTTPLEHYNGDLWRFTTGDVISSSGGKVLEWFYLRLDRDAEKVFLLDGPDGSKQVLLERRSG